MEKEEKKTDEIREEGRTALTEEELVRVGGGSQSADGENEKNKAEDPFNGDDVALNKWLPGGKPNG